MNHEKNEAELRVLAAENSRTFERACRRIALRYINGREEPQFNIESSDFNHDSFLICADYYWKYRFHLEPTLVTAVECASWMAKHVATEFYDRIRDKWAIGFGFVNRDSVESASEVNRVAHAVIADDDDDGRSAFFATLFHAEKLCANHAVGELDLFLEQSPLASAAGPHRESVLFRAFRTYVAFCSHRFSHEHACALFGGIWNSSYRSLAATDVVLHGLAMSHDFDGRRELLRTHASEAVAEYPDEHIFYYRLATGQWLCGDHESALGAIDAALGLLSVHGGRISHELLQGQYLARREAIEVGREQDRRARAERARAEQERSRAVEQDRTLSEQTKHEVGQIAESVRGSVLWTVQVMAVFAAVIGIAVGSLSVGLNGSRSFSESLWLVAALDGGLAIFALLTVGGNLVIMRWLSKRK